MKFILKQVRKVFLNEFLIHYNDVRIAESCMDCVQWKGAYYLQKTRVKEKRVRSKFQILLSSSILHLSFDSKSKMTVLHESQIFKFWDK